MRYSIPLLTISLMSISAILLSSSRASANPIVERVNGSAVIQRGRRTIELIPGETVIRRRDIVHVGSGSRISVLCTPNEVALNRRPLRGPSRSGVRRICDNGNPINRDFCTISSEFLQGQNPEVPYIITPRSGKILAGDILLRWNEVEAAHTYTIRIETPRSLTEWETVWTTTTANTQILYSGEVALSPNVPYTLTVETDTGISSVENSSIDKFSRSFFITNDAESLEAAISTVGTQALSEEESILAIATAYTCQAQPLTANAITYLENAIAEQPESPSLFKALGDLYYGSGLADLAEQSYLRAIAAANLNTYLEEWVTAQEGLARVYRRTGRTELAQRYLQQAELGAYYTCDQAALERIAESMAALIPVEEAAFTESMALQPLSCEVSFD